MCKHAFLRTLCVWSHVFIIWVLSPPQRLLWLIAQRLGRGACCAGDCGKGEGEERSGSHPFLLPVVPRAPLFYLPPPLGSLCRGERSEYDKPLECQAKYFNFGSRTTHMKTTIHVHLGHIRHFTSNIYFQDCPTHFYSTFKNVYFWRTPRNTKPVY